MSFSLEIHKLFESIVQIWYIQIRLSFRISVKAGIILELPRKKGTVKANKETETRFFFLGGNKRKASELNISKKSNIVETKFKRLWFESSFLELLN